MSCLRVCHSRLLLLLPVLLAQGGLRAQSTGVAKTPPGQAAKTATPYSIATQVPDVMHRNYLAVGDRITKPGKERVTFTGTLTDASGAANVRIVIELGGKASVQWIGGPGGKVTFDGTSIGKSTASGTADDLITTFVDDLPETAMALLARGSGVHFAGRRFPDSTKGLCDYFDIASLGTSVKETAPVAKRYCFDSSTFLLRSVRYTDPTSPQTTVVTQFGAWSTVSGASVPGSIIRARNGTREFDFEAQTATVSAAANDNTFQP